MIMLPALNYVNLAPVMNSAKRAGDETWSYINSI